MRDSYVPLFRSVTTSSLWALPSDVRIAWFYFIASADEEGFVSGTVPGLALAANVPVEAMRRAIGIFEAPDPDSRTPDLDGRRLEHVARGWRIVTLVAARKRAVEEAERARKRRHAQAVRARDHEPPELAESQRGAGVGRGPEPATSASSREDALAGAPADIADFAPSNDEEKREASEAVQPERIPPVAPGSGCVAVRSETVDARKRKLPPPPPPDQIEKRKGEEEVRFYDLEGFEPSAGLVAWLERGGLPPMALHARLGKIRNAKVAIGGRNGVGDREQWCRDQLPRWKKWWLDDGGRAEPLPVTRRPEARPPPMGGGTPMPEALARFVATGVLPGKPPARAAPAAEVAA